MKCSQFIDADIHSSFLLMNVNFCETASMYFVIFFYLFICVYRKNYLAD